MQIFDLPLGELLTFAAAIVAAGVVASLLAGVFGIGGGAVLVPVFYQVFTILGIDQSVAMHLSVGTSLAIIVPTGLRSFQGHYARGAVDMDLLRSFVVPVPLGVVLASLAAAVISSEGLRVIFAVLIFALGMRLLFNRDSWRLGSDIPGNPVRGVIAFLIGFFSTLMGIGGGIINNTLMTLYGRSMHQAVATSSGLGILISIPGTIGYIWAGWGDPHLPIMSTGFVNWIAVALVIPLAVVVTPYGVAIAHALGRRHLEWGFGLFCIIVALRFAWSLF